jgi:hypothetical protein
VRGHSSFVFDLLLFLRGTLATVHPGWIAAAIPDTESTLFSKREGRKHDKVNHTEREYVHCENGLYITANAVERVLYAAARNQWGIPSRWAATPASLSDRVRFSV